MLGETAVAFWAEHDDAEYLARTLMGGVGREDEERDNSQRRSADDGTR